MPSTVARLIVLQRAGDDLGGRGRPAVDQHDHRQGLQLRTHRLQMVDSTVAKIVPALREQAHLRVLGHAFGEHDRRTGRQERRRHPDGGAQQPARIVAQVQHDTGDAGVVLVQESGQPGHQALGRMDLELRQADVRVTRVDQAHPDAAAVDQLAGHGEAPDLVLAIARHGELDRRAALPADLLNDLLQALSLNAAPADCDDDIARLDACPRGRPALEHRHHLDAALLHRDLEAEPAVLATVVVVQLAKGLGIEIGRMRIEAAQHAIDRTGDELGVVDGLDVVGLDLLEYVGDAVHRRTVSGNVSGVAEGWKRESARRRHGQAPH